MSFVNDLHNGLTNLVGDGKRFRNNSELARYCNVEPIFTHRYLHGPKKGLTAIGDVLDKLGAKLVFPEEDSHQRVTRDVCFVDTRIVSSGEHIPPPQVVINRYCQRVLLYMIQSKQKGRYHVLRR